MRVKAEDFPDLYQDKFGDIESDKLIQAARKVFDRSIDIEVYQDCAELVVESL